jgi:mannosyl-3-phosphoglycerate phosphatase
MIMLMEGRQLESRFDPTSPGKGLIMKKVIVFTDLDGTLLDAASYSFEGAMPAIGMLRCLDIPIICCSSKTRPEIEHYREIMNCRHPFVSENGGGIFIPRGYFPATLRPVEDRPVTEGAYEVITLGTPYPILRRVLGEIREMGFAVQGFGDLTPAEIVRVTGLTMEQAEMARQRDFDEPFLFHGPAEGIPSLVSAVEARGLKVTQGKFFHILGDNDKGKAVSILSRMYGRAFGEVKTIGLGDSLNDLPMLQRVDYPVVVKKPDGRYDPRLDVPGIIRAKGVGPEGWNRAVLGLLQGWGMT